jgi:hypothetical protein
MESLVADIALVLCHVVGVAQLVQILGPLSFHPLVLFLQLAVIINKIMDNYDD